MISRRAFGLVAAAALISGCSLRDVACGKPLSERAASQAAQQQQAQAAAPAEPGGAAPTFKIAFLGDSLTAGLGLLSQQAYPALVEDLFAAEGYDQIESINAGISGDTTAGGRRRIEQTLEPGVRILLLALGANDALRGLSVGQSRENLKAIIETARGKGIRIVLCGMEAPPNLGEDYRVPFREMYQQLAIEFRNDVKFVPFLLTGVAGDPAMNQADGIHPNEQGAKVIAGLVYPVLRSVVDDLGGGGE